MTFRCTPILVLITLHCVLGSQLENSGPSAPADASLVNAQDLISKQRWPEAVQLLSAAISNAPSNPEPLLYRGACFAALEQWRDARDDFSRAAAMVPANPLAWLYRGVVERALGNYSNAISDFSAALRLDPANKTALLSRAAAHDALGQWQAAINDATSGLKLDSGDSQGFHLRAHALFMSGRFPEAARDYSRALELNRTNEAACNGFSWMLATCPERKLRDGTKAVELARQACDLTGWKDWARLDTLAAAYAQAGNFEKALEFQRRALQLSPSAKVRWELEHALRLYEKGKPHPDGTQVR